MIEIQNGEKLLGEAQRIADITGSIQDGEIVVLKKAVDPKWITGVRGYLEEIGRHSLPNYHAIQKGCPNFHRLNHSDDRAYVKGCFHQFSFFPWNQDVFEFFNYLEVGFQIKNLVNGLPRDKFIGNEPEDGCTARVTFQFYPAGQGFLNKHSDPVDRHQLAVPTLTMSRKGTDFKTGGAYVELPSGEKVQTDEISDVGDIVLFNAKTPHGVELIDSDKQSPWLSFEGRWVMLYATNKVQSVQTIQDAIDLESPES